MYPLFILIPASWLVKNYAVVHKIRHFACERDIYAFRNHTWRHISSHSISLKNFEIMRIRHSHTNETSITRKCLIRMIQMLLRRIVWLEYCLICMISKVLREIDWLEICLIQMISRHKKSLSQESVLFYGHPRTRISIDYNSPKNFSWAKSASKNGF